MMVEEFEKFLLVKCACNERDANAGNEKCNKSFLMSSLNKQKLPICDGCKEGKHSHKYYRCYTYCLTCDRKIEHTTFVDPKNDGLCFKCKELRL